ncbi:MAG: putative CRISPR-associated protein [Burkholderiales bacterium RIFOXYC12_FULL_65_23]|uniref:CRISPR-associated protein Csx16 n=1 Tax=Malikia spinosa TaxID=86180 RepID=UPI0008AE4460|nr:CRISPR-associated protein Csx16 [Malikia spinosa]OGB72112.1 MAG: putative CRISPR-associated protein [Burkholderiales bacterium RIFOXYC12_FULL_65_23]
MTTWFITRHPGAIDWAHAQQLQVDHFVNHLDPALIRAGDTVMGSLPVHLAAAICERGARYLHLSLDLPAELRGRELSVQQLHQFSARLRPFQVTALPASVR